MYDYELSMYFIFMTFLFCIIIFKYFQTYSTVLQ